jgi:hypothetical protein
LNGKSRARLLAKSSVDTAGEIDSEPSRIAASICPLGRLHRDTTDWADGRAEIARHATFLAIRITSEDDDGPGPGKQWSFVIRVLFRNRLPKEDLERGCKPFCQASDTLCHILNSNSLHSASHR